MRGRGHGWGGGLAADEGSAVGKFGGLQVGTLTQNRVIPGTTMALHVLVVLRDARAARAHGLSLQLQGCRVTIASHVRRAVELAVEELPDLILTDAGDMLRQLLAADPRTRQIPILAGGAA